MDLTPMYWLILHLIWRMISWRRMSLKEMVMISLQVRLYETLCKSNMMSDNFELWGWISVGGWSPQSRHRPKSFAQNTIGFCKSQRNWFNQRKERKTELWTGRRSGKQFPLLLHNWDNNERSVWERRWKENLFLLFSQNKATQSFSGRIWE